MTNRFRSGVFISVLSLSGCTEKAPETPQFPKEISTGLHSSGWELRGVQSAGSMSTPAAVRDTHPRAAWMANYAGPVKAHARVWAVTGLAVALEIVQHWKAEPNTVVFYNDRYFAAVDYEPVDRDAAAALVRGLEKALGPRPE